MLNTFSELIDENVIYMFHSVYSTKPLDFLYTLYLCDKLEREKTGLFFVIYYFFHNLLCRKSHGEVICLYDLRLQYGPHDNQSTENLNVGLIVCCFSSCSRIFHSYYIANK